MRVKARLTSVSITQTSAPEVAGDPDLRALAVLFNEDPIVSMDDKGWFLSSTRLDTADDERRDGALRTAADALLLELNGAAMLLRSALGWGAPVRLTNEFEGALHRESGWAYVTVRMIVDSVEGLDPASGKAVLELIGNDPWVRRVTTLLEHVDEPWVWFESA